MLDEIVLMYPLIQLIVLKDPFAGALLYSPMVNYCIDFLSSE